MAFPALTFDLLVKKACPTLASDHVGTSPIIISERPNTYIWSTHDAKNGFNISIWSPHDAKIDTTLTSDQHMIRRMAHPALTSDLLIRKACPTLTYDHVGTNPIIISERPITHIHQHDRTHLLSSMKRLCTHIQQHGRTHLLPSVEMHCTHIQ